MTKHIYAYDSGNGQIEVVDRGSGDLATVSATKVQPGPWIGNNRRTDYWFTWRGVRYHGHCGEDRTGFKPRALKSL
jgi:hypothetical protein